jgi:hypothetical protein
MKTMCSEYEGKAEIYIYHIVLKEGKFFMCVSISTSRRNTLCLYFISYKYERYGTEHISGFLKSLLMISLPEVKEIYK